MAYPPRLSHLATQKIVVGKLVPTFAAAHLIDENEAHERLMSALKGSLLDQLLDATWAAIVASAAKPDDDKLLQKVATGLKNPYRSAKPIEPTAGWSAFMVLVDIEAGTATDAARRLLETDEGRKRGQLGIREVAVFLAKEITRK